MGNPITLVKVRPDRFESYTGVVAGLVPAPSIARREAHWSGWPGANPATLRIPCASSRPQSAS